MLFPFLAMAERAVIDGAVDSSLHEGGQAWFVGSRLQQEEPVPNIWKA